MNKNTETNWDVYVKRKVQRTLGSLPKIVKDNLFTLIKEIESYGDLCGNARKSTSLK